MSEHDLALFDEFQVKPKIEARIVLSRLIFWPSNVSKYISDMIANEF
jgi:hypothetical protein